MKKILFLALACCAIFKVFPTPLLEQLEAWSALEGDKLPAFDPNWLTKEDKLIQYIGNDGGRGLNSLPISQAVERLQCNEGSSDNSPYKSRVFWVKVIKSLLNSEDGTEVGAKRLFGPTPEVVKKTQEHFVNCILRIGKDTQGSMSELLSLLIEKYGFNINNYNNDGSNTIITQLYMNPDEHNNWVAVGKLLKQLNPEILNAADSNNETIPFKLLYGDGHNELLCDTIVELIESGNIKKETIERRSRQYPRDLTSLALRYKSTKLLKTCRDKGRLTDLTLSEWDDVNYDAHFVKNLKKELPELITTFRTPAPHPLEKQKKEGLKAGKEKRLLGRNHKGSTAQPQESRLTEQGHQAHQQVKNADNTETVQPQADNYNKLMIGGGVLLSAVVLTSIIYLIAKKREASEKHHQFS